MYISPTKTHISLYLCAVLPESLYAGQEPRASSAKTLLSLRSDYSDCVVWSESSQDAHVILKVLLRVSCALAHIQKGSPNELSFSIILIKFMIMQQYVQLIKILFISTPLKNKNQLLPVWKISLVTIIITGARTIHWNWEQNTCIAKWMCTSADCNRHWKSPTMIHV